MHARRDDIAKPAWTFDQPTAPLPPELEDPYFDEDLNAWVLSRHSDLLAAFRSPALLVVGYNTKVFEPLDPAAHAAMRAETIAALSPAQLRDWNARLTDDATQRVMSMPAESRVDLVADFARPTCLRLAAMVTGADLADANRLTELARTISTFSSEPSDQILRAASKKAVQEMQGCFHADRPESLRDSGFVALTQTLPALLANAWYALLMHPSAWSDLHREPAFVEQAIEELLRYSGITRMVVRGATEDVEINGTRILKGQRVLMRVFAANRDPAQFPRPEELDVQHPQAGHLTLGAGVNACVGASLIRMATAALTRPLLQRFASVTVDGTIDWRGGSGFLAPAALPVFLHEDAPSFSTPHEA